MGAVVVVVGVGNVIGVDEGGPDKCEGFGVGGGMEGYKDVQGSVSGGLGLTGGAGWKGNDCS